MFFFVTHFFSYFFLVPQQRNGYDCGLFVCRYAYAMYQMRNETITYHDIYKEKSSLLSKITNSQLFQFNQKLINEFRIQLGQLIDNLSSVYQVPPIEGALEILTIELEDEDSVDKSKPSEIVDNNKTHSAKVKSATNSTKDDINAELLSASAADPITDGNEAELLSASAADPITDGNDAELLSASAAEHNRDNIDAAADPITDGNDGELFSASAAEHNMDNIDAELLSGSAAEPNKNDMDAELISTFAATPNIELNDAELLSSAAAEPNRDDINAELLSAFAPTSNIELSDAELLSAKHTYSDGIDAALLSAAEPNINGKDAEVEQVVAEKNPAQCQKRKIGADIDESNLDEGNCAPPLKRGKLDTDNLIKEDNLNCHIDGDAVKVSEVGSERADKVQNVTANTGRRCVKTKAAIAPRPTPTKGKRVGKANARTPTKSTPTKGKRVTKAKAKAASSTKSTPTKGISVTKAKAKAATSTKSTPMKGNSVTKAKTKAATPMNTMPTKGISVTRAKVSSTPAYPFVGKAVAFSRNSEFAKQLINELGKKWVEEAVCYHLDAKVEHLVGTVMRKSRGVGKNQRNQINYDVVWEFSSLGETNVPYSYLLDGNKTAEKLLRSRSKMKSRITVGGEKSDASHKASVRKKEPFESDNRILKLRDNLCKISDDAAEMKVSVLLFSRYQIHCT